MATFRYKTVKHMAPRAGVKYSTDYYKQSQAEYDRTLAHIESVISDVITQAQDLGLTATLEDALPGYPRTRPNPNYSTLDILTDLLEQMRAGRDIPSGMLGRWNRLFADNDHCRIDMEEDRPPTPGFNGLFRTEDDR